MYGTSIGWIVLVVVLATGAGIAWWSRSRRHSAPTEPTRLIFTNHVKQRMIERSVGQRQIELTVAAPTRRIPDAKNNSLCLEREFDGRTLKVWVVQASPAEGETVIKSTAWADLVITFQIPTDLTGLIVGRHGATVGRLEATHDARISVSRNGAVRVSAGRCEAVESAKRDIIEIVAASTLRLREAA